jgi:hypothetical protein
LARELIGPAQLRLIHAIVGLVVYIAEPRKPWLFRYSFPTWPEACSRF